MLGTKRREMLSDVPKVDLKQWESWGRYPKVGHRGAFAPTTRDEIERLVATADGPLLPRGMGRSYGDSCLNEDGYLILNEGMSRIQAFDEHTGIVRCESGVTLDMLLTEFVPVGWFPPVVPGTRFISIGGAIANDVHGKNHHVAGSFGNHVLQLELLRSDGTTLTCSDSANPDWFHATIGGLGLTGYILRADVQLKPIPGPYVDVESIKFGSLGEFAAIVKESSDEYEYSVAWIDCVATGKKAGRGIFMRGNHSDRREPNPKKAVHRNPVWKSVPFDMPAFLLCQSSVALFNFAYYHKQFSRHKATVEHYAPYYFPLDGIRNWNRMYGRRGFLQWQCTVPFSIGYECIGEILGEIARSKLASFLAVIKEFGGVPPKGMLSFPMPGITLALDLANVGRRLFELLDRLDSVVTAAGGRIYPAKDARMSPETFTRSFPRFAEFQEFVDPKISSSFYRRIKAAYEPGCVRRGRQPSA